MANFTLTLPAELKIEDGKMLSFKAPSDSGNIENVIINDIAYQLLDVSMNPISAGLFKAGAVLCVLMDVTNQRAYLQGTGSMVEEQAEMMAKMQEDIDSKTTSYLYAATLKVANWTKESNNVYVQTITGLSQISTSGSGTVLYTGKTDVDNTLASSNKLTCRPISANGQLTFQAAGIPEKDITLSIISVYASLTEGNDVIVFNGLGGGNQGGGSYASVVPVSGGMTLKPEHVGTFLSVGATATITVPTMASANLPIGAEIEIYRASNGVVTIAPQSGVKFAVQGKTSTEAANQIIAEQYASIVLKQISADLWSIQGAI